MKTKLILLTLIISTFSFSQKDTVVASDGTKIAFKFLYDDPENMPKFEFNIYPLTVMVLKEEPHFCLRLQPRYKISEKLYTDLDLKIPYTERLDGLTKKAKTTESKKKTIDLNLLAHYRLFYQVKEKEKALTIKRKSNGVNITAYRIFPWNRKFGRSFYLDGGLNYLQYNEFVNNPSNNVNTVLNGSNFVNLTIGGTFNFTESYSFISSGKTQFNWNRISLYARLQYGISNKKDIYKITTDNNGDNIYTSTQQYDDLYSISNSIGYRAGINFTMGRYSKFLPFSIGFETGKVLSFDSINQYFSFHLGFGITKFNK